MTKLITAILCVLCAAPLMAQQTGKIVVKTPTPAGDIVVFFKALAPGEHTKQLLAKAAPDGSCPIPYTGKVFVHISCNGYKPISDTLSGTSYTNYTLSPLSVQLNEVVTTGQYEAKPLSQSVFNTTVISRTQIEQRGDNTVRDALMEQMNIRLNEDPILGTQIKMQGISGDNIKILIDGVPVIGRNNGNLDLSQLTLANIELIEITQGPMSVMYGTDALGGVINLITKKEFLHPAEAHVHLNAESIGKYNADADLTFHAKNNTLTFNGGRNFFSGYPKDTGTQRAHLWKPRLQAFGGMAFSHTFSKATVQLKSQYFNELIANLGDPTVTPFYAYAIDAYYRTIRWDNSISANYRFNNYSHLDIVGSYNFYRNRTLTYRKDLVSLEKQLTDASNQDTTTFDAWVWRAVYSNINPTHRLSYQAGVDINNEAGYGSLLNKGLQHINDDALFGSAEWKPTENTLIRPALRVSANSIYGTSLGILNNAKFTPLLPSLNIKQNIKKNLVLRLGVARGYRAPALKELDLDFVDANHNIHGNPNLKAEKSGHTDIQLTWNYTLNNLRLKCEPMLFYNNIRNLITLVETAPTPLTYQYYNVGRYVTYGVTAPVYVYYKSFNAGVGYSLTALFDSLSNTVASAARFTYTSEVTATAGYHYTPFKMALNVYYKYTGPTPGYTLDAYNHLTHTTIAGYSILDAGITKYLYNRRLTLSAGVKNILNVTSVFSNAPVSAHQTGGSQLLSPGRSLFIDLRLYVYTSPK